MAVRKVVFDNGKVQQLGLPEDMFYHPKIRMWQNWSVSLTSLMMLLIEGMVRWVHFPLDHGYGNNHSLQQAEDMIRLAWEKGLRTSAIPVLNKNTCERWLNIRIFRNNFIPLSTFQNTNLEACFEHWLQRMKGIITSNSLKSYLTDEKIYRNCLLFYPLNSEGLKL